MARTNRAQAGVGGVIVLMLLLIGVAGAVAGYAAFDGLLAVVGAIGGFVAVPAALLAMQGLFIGLFEYFFPAVFAAVDRSFTGGLEFLLPEHVASTIHNVAGFAAVIVAIVCILFTLPITMGNMIVAVLVVNAFSDLAGVATYVIMTVIGLTAMAMADM